MGRPRKIETAKDMERAIKRYFKDCEGKILKDEYGRPVISKGFPVVVGAHPPTVTGLARALGLGSRQSLLNYQGREEFSGLIEDAKARVMEYAEERLYDRDGQRGAEFNLRFNFGWGAAEKNPDDEGGGVVVLAPVKEDRQEGEGECEKCGSGQGAGERSRPEGQEDPGPGPGAGGHAEGGGDTPEGER